MTERKLRSLPRLTAVRWAMAAFYLTAGIVHLLAPERFLPIVPDFVAWPREVVLATGVCEIAGSLALLSRRLRRLAGVMLALYAVCNPGGAAVGVRRGRRLGAEHPKRGKVPCYEEFSSSPRAEAMGTLARRRLGRHAHQRASCALCPQCGGAECPVRSSARPAKRAIETLGPIDRSPLRREVSSGCNRRFFL
jgi:hypothetical protein